MRHVKERTPWSRRRKLTTLVVGLVAVPLAAWAIFQLIAGFTGSIDRGTAAVTPTAIINEGGACTGTISGDDVSLTWPNAFPGDTCQLRVEYQPDSGNTIDLKFQDFATPTGVSAVFANSTCGRLVFPSGSTSYPGVVVLTIEDGVNDPISFNPALHGFVLVRDTDFVAGGCPT